MRRSTHLVKGTSSRGLSSLAQSERTVVVRATGSSRREKRSYSFMVEVGGSIRLGEGTSLSDVDIRADNRAVKGAIYGERDVDRLRVQGEIVSSEIPSGLTLEDPGTNGGNGGGNGRGNGGGNGNGNGSGGNGKTTGGGTDQQQAGMSTSTLLIGGGIVAAVGVAAFTMSGNGQSNLGNGSSSGQ